MNGIRSFSKGVKDRSCLIEIVLAALMISYTMRAQQLAFPTAEGAGKNTRGGRGGTVYEVTNVNDSGPGSLRDAVEKKEPRTIVFRVSGTIILQTPLIIENPFLTIAGQTAPGDGICLREHNFMIAADEVIIRYIRVRLGDLDTLNQSDAFSGERCHNVIIDHCSVSWSIDEAMSLYRQIENVTVQWCFISESLRFSHHLKGEHGYGGIWGGKNTSWHHNLLAHHSSRNPRFDRGLENVDFRNNIIYNWKYNSTYGGEASSKRRSTINVTANYYKAGPATDDGPMRNRIVNPWSNLYGWGLWYIAQNEVFNHPEITNDNWKYGVQGIGNETISFIRVDEPFPIVSISQQTPQEAYRCILAHGGASLPNRDSIDRRIVWEVENDTALYGGKTGSHTGIIDSQNDVGGWPELKSIPAPRDSDHDGMPDDWEINHMLNPKDSEDRNIIHTDGYTMLEEYLNSLTIDTTVK
jgi:pectate lyase